MDSTGSDGSQNAKQVTCRATMEEGGMDQVRLRVRLEDVNGNVPTGARVLLQTPEQEISWVYYNSVSAMYESNLSGLTSGAYTVTVDSAAGNSLLSIPMTLLSATPDIITLQDAHGITAGHGQNMSGSCAVSAAWKPIEGATVYKGTVYCGAVTAFVFSSSTNSFMIPPDTLVGGRTYNLSIEAQYIGGDPYLQEHNYYAFSYSESPDYFFTIE